MSLAHLFTALADACDDRFDIEAAARNVLLDAAGSAVSLAEPVALPASFRKVLSEDNAHHSCKLIADCPLPWSIPKTSDDPAYQADSSKKLIVELIGPDGPVASKDIRVGLYGIAPGAHYGYRTHPAEEVFVMLAGEADWAKGEGGFTTLRPGERSYHPSMMRHATITRYHAFMSLYVWRGDVSFDGYVYQGKNSD